MVIYINTGPPGTWQHLIIENGAGGGNVDQSVESSGREGGWAWEAEKLG